MKTTLLFFSACVTGITAFAQADFHLDKEFKASSTGTIDLIASDAKVYITGSKRSTVHVKIDREVTTKGVTFGDDNQQFAVEVTESSGDLKIRERRKGNTIGVIGVYNERYRIEIEAPEGMSLAVRGDDGDYFIKNVNGSMDMSLDDADVELAGCGGNKFAFRLDDGDLRMDQGKGSFDVDGDDSDVQVYNAAFKSIHADIDDGNLRIETSLDDKGVYELTSEDGTIAMTILSGGGEFDIHHDDGSVDTDGGFKTLEKSEHATRMVLASGSAKVSLRGDDARIRLAAR
jgi:hypothetical protein